MTNDIQKHFEARLPAILETIRRLVEIESPSSNIEALNEAATFVADLIAEKCPSGSVEWHFADDGRPHLVVRFGERTDVLLLGHFDTVHPVGTLAEHPVRIEGDRFYGPGALDMKPGVVMMVELAAYLLENEEAPNLTLFFNSDEEIGSDTSGDLLRSVAADATVVYSFEFTLHEFLLKIGARGIRRFSVTVTGKGGHAAYAEHNVNPVDALADIIISARSMHDPGDGIVVEPTVISGSDTANVVPNSASIVLECRGNSEEQLERVERQIRRLKPRNARMSFDVERIVTVETFPVREDNKAFEYALKAANLLGLPEPKGVEARGAGDMNQLVRVAPNVLEGLGGWGDGPHDPLREHVMISSLVPSVALSALMTKLCLKDEQ